MEKQVRILFDKWLNNQCTDEEVKLLVDLLQKDEAENILNEPMEILWEQPNENKISGEADWNKMYEVVTAQSKERGKLISIRRFVLAAACILLLVVAGYWLS